MADCRSKINRNSERGAWECGMAGGRRPDEWGWAAAAAEGVGRSKTDRGLEPWREGRRGPVFFFRTNFFLRRNGGDPFGVGLVREPSRLENHANSYKSSSFLNHVSNDARKKITHLIIFTYFFVLVITNSCICFYLFSDFSLFGMNIQ